jgi:hypothetical protein
VAADNASNAPIAFLSRRHARTGDGPRLSAGLRARRRYAGVRIQHLWQDAGRTTTR